MGFFGGKKLNSLMECFHSIFGTHKNLFALYFVQNENKKKWALTLFPSRNEMFEQSVQSNVTV